MHSCRVSRTLKSQVQLSLDCADTDTNSAVFKVSRCLHFSMVHKVNAQSDLCRAGGVPWSASCWAPD